MKQKNRFELAITASNKSNADQRALCLLCNVIIKHRTERALRVFNIIIEERAKCLTEKSKREGWEA